MHREPQPVKAYTIAPMYRYGAPGRGRYREHYQLSRRGDRLGRSGDRRRDHPALHRAAAPARRHAVGAAPELDRRRRTAGPQYVERLNAWLDAHADVLDEDARHKRATSPLQVFDVKNPSVRAALEDAPKIGESLCDACRAHFDARAARTSTRYGVPYVLDPTLVRGLDYYTRTTFEFIGPDENANSTICGGGRYDGLVEAVGGAADAGDRLRRRHRAAAARARERGHHCGAAAARRLLRRRRRRAARRVADRARRAAPRGRRGRHRLRRALAQGADDAGRRARARRTVVIVARRRCDDRARGRGDQDVIVALGEVVATLTGP